MKERLLAKKSLTAQRSHVLAHCAAVALIAEALQIVRTDNPESPDLSESFYRVTA
jgi:HD superfamily phosphodiesterase